MEKRIHLSSLKRVFFLGGLIGIAAIIYALPWMFWQLQIPVKQYCSEAQEEFGGDCVEALIEVARSDQHAFLERNRAIWSLGQLADDRALPALRELQSEEPCQRPCRRDLHLCQYEIEKAIKWCHRGTLFSFWMRASVVRDDPRRP